MNLGIGAEQFGIDAANFSIGLDSGNAFVFAATADAIHAQQEELAKQAQEPECQPDIVITSMLTTSKYVQVPPVVTEQEKQSKRKYTKRAK